MRILRKTRQYRRDYSAIMVCEHCSNQQMDGYGYDDSHYHSKVIPKMKCGNCGKTASNDYTPSGTKYPDGRIV